MELYEAKCFWALPRRYGKYRVDRVFSLGTFNFDLKNEF